MELAIGFLCFGQAITLIYLMWTQVVLHNMIQGLYNPDVDDEEDRIPFK